MKKEQKSLGQVAYESSPEGGQQNFGPWSQAPEVVRRVHEQMALAVKKEVERRQKRKVSPETPATCTGERVPFYEAALEKKRYLFNCETADMSENRTITVGVSKDGGRERMIEILRPADDGKTSELKFGLQGDAADVLFLLLYRAKLREDMPNNIRELGKLVAASAGWRESDTEVFVRQYATNGYYIGKYNKADTVVKALGAVYPANSPAGYVWEGGSFDFEVAENQYFP
jgi:hypothetical protein